MTNSDAHDNPPITLQGTALGVFLILCGIAICAGAYGLLAWLFGVA